VSEKIYQEIRKALEETLRAELDRRFDENEAEVRKILRAELRLISIFVDNGLDQPVTVQVKANREKALAKSVNVGSAFTVSAGATDFRSLSVETSGWLPYVTVTLQCATAPTSGSVTVYRIRSKDDEVKLVVTLEIRDTALHDNSTDPTQIFVEEW